MPSVSVNQPDLPMSHTLQLMREGEVREVHGLIPWGSNYTFLVMVNDGQHEALAVYKPRSGEQPLWDFPEGTLCQREQAAFLVSEALGWGIVPATVLREGPHGPGSIQFFVPHDPDENYFTFGRRFRSQMQRIALFDEIVNNADRKGSHCLLDAHKRIWAIDHGVCFNAQPKLRTVIWDFAGQAIPGHLLEEVGRLCVALESGNPVGRDLETLLDAREIEALRHRTSRLMEVGVYSQPGTGRSYPWPPV